MLCVFLVFLDLPLIGSKENTAGIWEHRLSSPPGGAQSQHCHEATFWNCLSDSSTWSVLIQEIAPTHDRQPVAPLSVTSINWSRSFSI